MFLLYTHNQASMREVDHRFLCELIMVMQQVSRVFHPFFPPSPGRATQFFAQIAHSLFFFSKGAKGKSLAWVRTRCWESTSRTEEGRERSTGKSATDSNTSESWSSSVAFKRPLNAIPSTASSLCYSFSTLLVFSFPYLIPSLSSVPISHPADSRCSVL